MREIRTYGSEGGATGVITGRSYPYPSHEPYQTLFWTIGIICSTPWVLAGISIRPEGAQHGGCLKDRE
jgi:hypothetical protein